MVLQPAATVLASLLLALPAAVPAGPDTAPAPSLRAAQSSPGQPAALAGPPGAPPRRLPHRHRVRPAAAVDLGRPPRRSAAGSRSWKGPSGSPTGGVLLFSDMGAATGSE